jgi:hypothetical protein
MTMDVDKLLQSVIRFSNFMTSRLIVAGIFFYVIAGFIQLGNASDGFLPNLELVNDVVRNYKTIFDILGVSDFALLLILFVFLTAIHIIHVAFDRIGTYLPPAIVPLSGWDAIDDLTRPAFIALRAARSSESAHLENQRLFEFDKKLREINAANEAKYRLELDGIYAAFRISKAFVLFAFVAWVYAFVSGNYTGSMNKLLVIFGIALLLALYSAFRIYRAHASRIDDLRSEVSSQFIGFAQIWTPQEHQAKVLEVCAAAQDHMPATFEIVVPIFGTYKNFKVEFSKWRKRRAGVIKQSN